MNKIISRFRKWKERKKWFFIQNLLYFYTPGGETFITYEDIAIFDYQETELLLK